MEHVRTIDQVAASLLRNAKVNTRRKQIYAARQAPRQKKGMEQYARLVEAQKIGRGELSVKVRPSFRLGRLQLRQGLAEHQGASDSGADVSEYAADDFLDEELDDAPAHSALAQNVVKMPARASLSQSPEAPNKRKKDRRKSRLVTSSEDSDELEIAVIPGDDDVRVLQGTTTMSPTSGKTGRCSRVWVR